MNFSSHHILSLCAAISYQPSNEAILQLLTARHQLASIPFRPARYQPSHSLPSIGSGCESQEEKTGTEATSIASLLLVVQVVTGI